MLNFDRMVLRPAMGAFARPVAFLPKEGTPYLGRGDFRMPTTDIQLDDGSLTTATPTLGIRAAEFATLPRQDDKVYVGVVRNPSSPGGFDVVPTTLRYIVMDVRPDGEGDIKLVLAEVSSP